MNLSNLTTATIASVTPRIEKHGDDDMPAVSVGFKATVPNSLLDDLSPGLMASLYKPAVRGEGPEQQQIEGTEISAHPLLRHRGIERLQLATELVGWTVTIDYGLDESSAVALADAKVDKFRISPMEGGSVEIAWRVGTNKVDEHAMGRLAMLNGTSVDLAMRPPEPKQEAIDGSVAAFERDIGADREDEPDATDLFVDAHGE